MPLTETQAGTFRRAFVARPVTAPPMRLAMSNRSLSRHAAKRLLRFEEQEVT